jgi:inorganic pyrophosphatase/exopolyphosphatase
LLNIPREDFRLRTDASWLLSSLLSANIADTLLFVEDEAVVCLLSSSKRVSLVLVDHNRLAETQSNLAPLVVAIVDHHLNESL